ncbi:MAG TPA: glycosyltransferase, partial [Alphaproteobacteria bacterium]|nr:glycosyltransferase [Alphaproteobacteria bacterium]
PSVVVPFLGDQPFWADRLHRLGAAPPAVPRRRLTAEALAAAIRAAEAPAMRDRAAALGAAVRAEDGIGHAVRALERAVAARGR